MPACLVGLADGLFKKDFCGGQTQTLNRSFFFRVLRPMEQLIK